MANSTLAHYTAFFSNWQANVLGSKPSAELLEKCHGLGLRPGKQALACAMSLRSEGVTGSQIVIACGAPQLNRMRGLIAEGIFKRHAAASNGQGHTVYMNTVTPKGESEIKRLSKVLANATASTAVPPKVAKVKTLSRKANKIGVAAVAAAVVPPVAVTPAKQPVAPVTAPVDKVHPSTWVR